MFLLLFFACKATEYYYTCTCTVEDTAVISDPSGSRCAVDAEAAETPTEEYCAEEGTSCACTCTTDKTECFTYSAL
jgi:hypothetical protein